MGSSSVKGSGAGLDPATRAVPQGASVESGGHPPIQELLVDKYTQWLGWALRYIVRDKAADTQPFPSSVSVCVKDNSGGGRAREAGEGRASLLLRSNQVFIAGAKTGARREVPWG